jgi:hypothetical protein
LDDYPVADISGKNGWNPKHFWAFVMWNFDTKAVEILQITQTTIQTAMEELNNDDWGDPLGYSITVNRKGEGSETQRPAVTGSTYASKHPRSLQREALFTGDKPFEAASEVQPVTNSADEDFAAM